MDKYITTFLATALLIAGNAFAATKPEAVIDMTTGFDTVEAAATVTIAKSLELENGHFYEYCGVIVKIDSKFYVTTPIVGTPDSCEYHYHGVYPVALYHTHPNGVSKDDRYTQFSDDDINQAVAVKVPSYVGIDHNVRHEVKVFVKGDKVECKTRYGNTVCFADGHEV